MKLTRWQKRPWTADELHQLAARLTDAGDHLESAAESLDRLEELAGQIANQLGRHARTDATGLKAEEFRIDPEAPEIDFNVDLKDPEPRD